ncbi:hypothetical protein ACFYO1_03340 [Nocardia sp. NPDC006044]|uniref:hypothetical protein n=1 Tax=Nocardia sp. NPDC006044 TaxID=3364306 RepID=UPI003684F592
MKNSIIGRLLVSAAAVATLAGAAGTAHADDLWFYVGTIREGARRQTLCAD